jgi:predicted amidohydrolase
MKQAFNVACVQNCAGPDMRESIADCVDLARAAHREGADLICTPEFMSCLDKDARGLEVGALPEAEHPALVAFKALAAELGVFLVLGSLAIRVGGERIRNRSYVIDATGAAVARYDKIHLFDVDLPNGESYRESDVFEPGRSAVVAPTPWGLLGLSVCYDLRFADLYRSLAQAGARYLTVPAAFTKTTGEAHWHLLLRSRAVETGSYVFAPCQFGVHGTMATYGHSLIVDPWGAVLADAGEGRGFAIARVDSTRVDEVRGMVPALRHDRRFSPPQTAMVEQASG